MELDSREWLARVRSEYLESFIPDGGAAVKFVVPYPPISADVIRAGLRDAADENGFQFAAVDAASTRLHLVDRLFHEVARQVDWDALAREHMFGLLSKHGYMVPRADQFDLAGLAQLNGREEQLLRQDIRRDIENGVFRDYEMSQEFRLAMIALCRSQLEPEPAADAIKDWLMGYPVRITSLKPFLIFQKIGRHNGRHMLFSLAHWLQLAGKKGLVLALDVSRYAWSVRPPEGDAENYYGAVAALDAWELLRQFIDGTDELTCCLIAVIAGPEFLADDRRGVRSYHALHLRIADDVHAADLQNPLAPLVRIRATSQS